MRTDKNLKNPFDPNLTQEEFSIAAKWWNEQVDKFEEKKKKEIQAGTYIPVDKEDKRIFEANEKLIEIDKEHEHNGITLGKEYYVLKFGSGVHDKYYVDKVIIRYRDDSKGKPLYFTGNDYKAYFPYEICSTKQDAKDIIEIATKATKNPSPIGNIYHYYDELKEKEGLSESELASYYVQMAKANKWNRRDKGES